MAKIDLIFKYDDLKTEGESFSTDFPLDVSQDAVRDLVGPSGYWVDESIEAFGTLYRSPNGEVILDGSLKGHARFHCVTCSAERNYPIETREDYIIVPKGHPAAEEIDESGIGELELSPDIYVFSGHEVKLTSIFRETLILNMPLHPRCETLNMVCRKVDEESATEEDQIDPRWAPLLAIRDQLKRQGDLTTDEEEPPKKP